MKFWNEMPERFKNVCVRLPILTLVISAVVYYFLGLQDHQVGNFANLGTITVPWQQSLQILADPIIALFILLYTYVYNKTLKRKEDSVFTTPVAAVFTVVAAFAFVDTTEDAFAFTAMFVLAAAGAFAVMLTFVGVIALVVVGVIIFAVAFAVVGIDPMLGALVAIILNFVLTVLFWSITKRPKFPKKFLSKISKIVWDFLSR